MVNFTPIVHQENELKPLLIMQAKLIDAYVAAYMQIQKLINIECSRDIYVLPMMLMQSSFNYQSIF